MNNYIPLNIQLFAEDLTNKEFQVTVYKNKLSYGSVEITLIANTTLSKIISQKYNKDVSYDWSKEWPTNKVSRIFREPYSDTLTCKNRFGNEYTVYIDTEQEDDPQNPIIIESKGIISLNSVEFSDIKFNNRQVSAIYYNEICIWTIEREKIPNNTLSYYDKYITYNDKYITYENDLSNALMYNEDYLAYNNEYVFYKEEK